MSSEDRNRLLHRLRLIAAEAYNEADGDIFVARRLLRRKVKQYGFDVATAMLLMQLALMLYKWAKDNGYLSELSLVAYPDEPSLLGSNDLDGDDDADE